ncbi:hypothetical protein [Yersinia ruckeri]|uniref:hypothetical protein n=1 Tax=Yersinia ruckeri TaxID=29486 RepID=UPI002238F008|nr:hypothetical protein [Yersinia ruckeri]MCW6542990.1 hypothetical protein [Yersinia ruckeri]MCW6591428.1 hypothetical protein [Yersinia ruckeri]UZX90865.1 hypothetical protein ND439_10870 [Yersinia ruckeri]
MFDFPQPNEQYCSDENIFVRVLGILHHGIPNELPYRCPDIYWNPYKKPYSIIIQIEHNGHIIELPLGHFLINYECIKIDKVKRDPANRDAVLKEMAQNPLLNEYREKNINRYVTDRTLSTRCKPSAVKTYREIWKQWKNVTPHKESDDYKRFL